MTLKYRIQSHKVIFQILYLISIPFILPILLVVITKFVLNYFHVSLNNEQLIQSYKIFIDISFFITILIVVKLWKLKFKEQLKIPTLKTFFYILVFTFCAFSYDIFLGTYFYEQIFDGKLPVIFFTSPRTGNIYILFKAIFFAPIYEELFYRKIVFNKLKQRYNLLTSMIVSSLFFAFGHLDFSIHLLSFFVIGLIFSYLYYKTNSILTVILLHSFYNVFNKFQKIIEIEFIPENYIYLLYYILGFVGVYYSFKKLAFLSKKNNAFFYFKDTKIYKYYAMHSRQ
jgi:membrane protease YdiL (CAAX protease family)